MSVAELAEAASKVAGVFTQGSNNATVAVGSVSKPDATAQHTKTLVIVGVAAILVLGIVFFAIKK